MIYTFIHDLSSPANPTAERAGDRRLNYIGWGMDDLCHTASRAISSGLLHDRLLGDFFLASGRRVRDYRFLSDRLFNNSLLFFSGRVLGSRLFGYRLFDNFFLTSSRWVLCGGVLSNRFFNDSLFLASCRRMLGYRVLNNRFLFLSRRMRDGGFFGSGLFDDRRVLGSRILSDRFLDHFLASSWRVLGSRVFDNGFLDNLFLTSSRRVLCGGVLDDNLLARRGRVLGSRVFHNHFLLTGGRGRRVSNGAVCRSSRGLLTTDDLLQPLSLAGGGFCLPSGRVGRVDDDNLLLATGNGVGSIVHSSCTSTEEITKVETSIILIISLLIISLLFCITTPEEVTKTTPCATTKKISEVQTVISFGLFARISFRASTRDEAIDDAAETAFAATEGTALNDVAESESGLMGGCGGGIEEKRGNSSVLERLCKMHVEVWYLKS